jgi:hypothetical protein
MHDVNEELDPQTCEPEPEPKVELPAGCVYRVLAAGFILFMLWLAYTLLGALVS